MAQLKDLLVLGDTNLLGALNIFNTVNLTGTLVLSKTTDAAGNTATSPALIIGGTESQAHIAIDANEIMAKSSGTATASLYLNNDGGRVYIGTGGLTVSGGGFTTSGTSSFSSGHLYLNGSNATSSTANTTQLVFGTSGTNHIAVTANDKALVLNPTTSTTTNQIVLYLNQLSKFPSGIQANVTGNLTGTADKAVALTTTAAGSNVQPIYWSNGKPVAANAYSTILTALSWSNRTLSITAGGTTKTGAIPANLTGFNRISFTTTDNTTSPTGQSIVLNGVTDDTTVAKAPGIGFHIGNKDWGSMKFLSDGTFRFYNNDCSSYKDVYVKNLYPSGNIQLSNTGSVVQTQNSTSNYTVAVKWLQGGVSEATYDPQIGHHNTGNTDGAMILLPYSTSTSPWNGADGLYIGKTSLKWNGASHAVNSGPTLAWGATATIGTVFGTALTVKMPANPNVDTKVTNTAADTTKFYITGTSSSSTNTGTQYFDTGIYSTTTSGQLSAGTLVSRSSLYGGTNIYLRSGESGTYARLFVSTAGTASTTEGTAGTTGVTYLYLGNSTAVSTTLNTGANNSYGILRIYGSNTGYTNIRCGTNNTSGYTMYLPGASGQFVYHANDTKTGGAVNPVYIAASGAATACNSPSSGAWFNSIPYVGTDGVMEIGRYIDFHYTSASTNDYDVRIDCAGNSKNVLYLPAITGQVVVHTNDTQRGSASLPVYVAASGEVTACTASSVFSAFSSSTNTLSITVAGQTRTASAVNSVSNTWANGTASAGPSLYTTVNGVSGTAVRMPVATNALCGATKVYKASDCTEYTDDVYTLTPAAVKKAFGMFNAVSSSALVGGTKLTASTVDSFLSGNLIKWAPAEAGAVGWNNDGMIVSFGWSSAYGAQLWLDDGSGEGGMRLRNRSSSGWNPWRAVLTSYGGSLDDGKQLTRIGKSSSWYNGRDNAMIRQTTISGYSPIMSIKSTNGTWEMGCYDNSSYLDRLIIGYKADSEYNAGTPNSIVQAFNLTKAGYLYLASGFSAGGNSVINNGTLTFTHSTVASQKITTSSGEMHYASASTIYIDSGSGSSLIFRPQGTEKARFDTSGVFQIKTTLALNNNTITGVNHLEFADPGVQEGITWTGGNGWYIYESPDDLTNAAGNLQFVHGSTRRLTINKDGYVDINARLVVRGNGSSYNEGIRILPASNGWSNIFFSANTTTLSDTHDGGWLIGRRGAAGSTAGAIGDFTIEEQSSNGANLTIHKNSGGATLKGRFIADGASIGGYSNTSYSLSTSSFICNSWIRTTGQTGWYNETYGGGWYMTDGTYIRAYNNKQVVCPTLWTGNLSMSSKQVVPPINTTNWYRVFQFAYSNASSQSLLLHVGRSYNSPQNEGYLFAISLGYNGDVNITQIAGHTGSPIVKEIRVDYSNSGTAYVDVKIAQSGHSNTFYFYGIGHGYFLDPAVTSATQSAQYSFTPGGKGFKTDGFIQTTKYGTAAPSGAASAGSLYFKYT